MQIKGEKYIYLLMAYTLAKQNKGTVTIGEDNNMVGGHNFFRRFVIQEYKGEELLVETKTSAHFADFSRCFVVYGGENKRPSIREYFNEALENCSKSWTH